MKMVEGEEAAMVWCWFGFVTIMEVVDNNGILDFILFYLRVDHTSPFQIKVSI